MKKSVKSNCYKKRTKCDICKGACSGQGTSKNYSDASKLYGEMRREISLFNSFIKPFYEELIENKVINRQPVCENCDCLIFTKSLFLEYAIYFYFYYKYKGQKNMLYKLFDRIKKISRAFDNVYDFHKIKRTATSVYVYILNQLSIILKNNNDDMIYIHYKLGNIDNCYKNKKKNSFDPEGRLERLDNNEKYKIIKIFDNKKSYYCNKVRIMILENKFKNLAKPPNYLCLHIKKIYELMIKKNVNYSKPSVDDIGNDEELRLYYDRKMDRNLKAIKKTMDEEFISYKLQNDEEKIELEKQNNYLLKEIEDLKKSRNSLEKEIEQFKIKDENLLKIINNLESEKKFLEHSYAKKSIEYDKLKEEKEEFKFDNKYLLSPDSLFQTDFMLSSNQLDNTIGNNFEEHSFLKKGPAPGKVIKPPPGFGFENAVSINAKTNDNFNSFSNDINNPDNKFF